MEWRNDGMEYENACKAEWKCLNYAQQGIIPITHVKM